MDVAALLPALEDPDQDGAYDADQQRQHEGDKEARKQPSVPLGNGKEPTQLFANHTGQSLSCLGR